jgi:DNA-binding transcriptional LysR family regulator
VRDNLNDLIAFVTVARERSFTKAAARLGVSQSALSQTMRALEERLGLRLLTRTTRRVAPTDAGERLLSTIGPRLDGIARDLAALSDMRDKPAGTIRITASEHAASSILLPKLMPLLSGYPDIKLEINTDYRMIDIVEQRFDAGVRLGEHLAKDMIAVRIGPDWRLAVVGSPAYFTRHGAPATPHALTGHACVNIRHRPSGSIYAWEFEKDGHAFAVKAEGQLVFNSIMHVLNAALDGIGLAYVPEPLLAPYLADGRLVQILADWCPTFQGYHLYYPNRRQASPAFSAFVEALRYRA